MLRLETQLKRTFGQTNLSATSNTSVGVGSNRYYLYRQRAAIDIYRRHRNSKRTVGLRVQLEAARRVNLSDHMFHCGLQFGRDLGSTFESPTLNSVHL